MDQHGLVITFRPGRLPLLLALTLAALVAVGLVAPIQAAAATGPVTYADQVYASSIKRPSADKPQSKLWYAHGSWWALMIAAGGTSAYIHQLMPDHTWRNTGALVDSRTGSNGEGSTGDALWSAGDNTLYVASRVTGSGSGNNLKIDAFTYGGGAWAMAPRFPVLVGTNGGSESATIDQDSTGRLWVTYTQGSKVWVAHSETDRAAWTAPPFQPNVPDTTITSDDLSAVIAFGTSIGIMWSDQQSAAFRFAYHRDGDADTTWTVETAWAAPYQADDHLNLKQLTGDAQGRIFAAIKTSANDRAGASPGDTLVGVLTRSSSGTWSLAPSGTVADDMTRPIIMIDATNQQLYFFATRPGSGGDIIYKTSPLNSISFPPGRGTPFVDAAPVLNNPTGAKDPVTAQTGLVILAVAEGKNQYYHAELALGGGSGGGTDTTPPIVTGTTPASGATDVAATSTVTAIFSEPVTNVGGSTFTLTGPQGPVPANLTLNGSGTVATLKPSTALSAGQVYTAALTSGITDLAGNPLANPPTWSFTVASSGGGTGSAPTLKSRSPAPDATSVGLSANVVVTFGKAVQGVGAGSFTVTAPNGQPVAGAFSSNSAKTRWTFNPSSSFAKDTRYTVTLTGGITDASGNAFAGTSWTFLAGPAPKLSGKTPTGTAVSRTTTVTATFNEAVTGVSTGSFVLQRGTSVVTTATVAPSGTTNRVWVLNPNTTLAPKTTYTVTVTSGITDLAGNPLTTVSWKFTTGP